MEFNTDYKREDFERGVEITKKYIVFCWNNYTYANNEFLGRVEFVNDVIDFVQGNKPYIPNRYAKTFEQFCQEKCEWITLISLSYLLGLILF